ncbi:CPR5 [Candida oxycetoniae]|uniref:peptidylprolyl isomerase n=1 Tax=Candida oxycetoniae TaxID=497107 RepID=A0AAI9STW3_9ASCO|nr:CPR5 [Candida oxycetoniae]KAI3402563.1 CPR5 [Candida oxycetoniae]
MYVFTKRLVSSAAIPGVTTSTFQLTSQEKQYLINDPKVTHKVIFTIVHGTAPNTRYLGKLTLALFGETVPTTVDNFYQLSAMTQGFGYKDCKFHRIINNFMIQGGDYDGQGGNSIYGKSFNDENFILKHDKLGRLSMANSGSNTNGAQFFILNVDETPHLDGHHVVFGQLVDGFETLQKISTVDVVETKPIEPVYISNIEIAVSDKDLQEAEEKAEQLKAEKPKSQADSKIEAEISQLSFIYPFLSIMSKNEFPIVCVKNLSFGASNKSIYEYFAQYGSIYQIRTNPLQQGQIFVIYGRVADAQRAAKESNGVNFNGRFLVTTTYQVNRSNLDEGTMVLNEQQLNELRQLHGESRI